MQHYKEFIWYEFDVSELLPKNWQFTIIEFAKNNGVSRSLIPTSVTSREGQNSDPINVMTVGGKKIKVGLPWLFKLYEMEFKSIGQTIVDEQISTANDERYAININIQKGTTMRYECHVDSNPLEGLLYITDHPKGAGGELVVSNRTTANGVKEILEDCKIIYPKAGHLVFFDARENPHFVTSLNYPDDIRVVVAMNYYMPSWSEEMRPKDLNKHLFGEL